MFKKLFYLGLLLLLTQTVLADQWPQWRGSKLDSISHESGLPSSLNDQNLLWRFELPGPGGASPIVWGDRIFCATVDGRGLALICVGTDGKMKWKSKLAGKNQNIRMDHSNSASPSPMTDGKHVWVMLSDGIVHCFDFLGQLVWKKNMQKEYGRFNIQFGMSSTPLLDNGSLYFQLIHGSMNSETPSRGKLICLDAKSGDEKWVYTRKTSGTSENKHSYTSPALYRHQDKEFLIVHGADFVTGHSLKDGDELWRIGGFNPKSNYNPYLRFVSSPVCTKDLIVVPSAKSGPVFGIDPKQDSIDKNAIKWKLRRGTPDVATPVISDDRVYLARENGVLICIDAKSGKKRFEERLLRDRHRSTPVVADGKVYLVGRDGTLIVLADENEFRVLSENELREDSTASPAVSDGVVYIRTNKALYAFSNR